MKTTKRFAGIIATLSLASSMIFAGSAVADTTSPPTNAELEANGTNCALSVVPVGGIDFGTFAFDSATGTYLQSGVTSKTTSFFLGITGGEPGITCDVDVHGSDLELDASNAIPVEHVSLGTGTADSTITAAINALPASRNQISTIATISQLTGTDASLINDGSVVQGNAYAVVGATLTLQNDTVLPHNDFVLPPGTYTGTITLTSTDVTP